ncbi:MAG: putative lipid II flippase FtsW [Acidimicrobiia bacterium]|nr:putative lipid II flippase FtsW [Acidimicrobiia bacterium]
MSLVAGSQSVRPLARVRRWWNATPNVRTPNSVLLVLSVAVLNAIGLVMVLSASSIESIDLHQGSPWWFFERQIVWTVLATIGFVVASRFDYRRWRSYTGPLLGVAFGLLFIVLIPGVGIYADGARRWIGYGQFRVQPSEIAKLALLVYAADVLTRRQAVLHDWRQSVRPVVLVLAGIGVLVMAEPDLASMMVIGVIAMATLIAAGVRLRHLGVLAGAAAAGVTMFALVVPWRRARMLAFLDPWHDRANTGYQVVQSLIATGSGGWTGVGLGAGRSKWGFLPAAHTDFIFAVIGEELGLVGAVLVIALFALIAVMGIRTAARAPDRFGMILATGVTAWIIGQAVLNLGGVVSLLPVTGVPLPFISVGGTALISTMVAAGLLVNVARQGRS